MAGRKPQVSISSEQESVAKAVCMCGARRAVVADLNDPLGQGRVKIRLPDLDEDGIWARATSSDIIRCA